MSYRKARGNPGLLFGASESRLSVCRSGIRWLLRRRVWPSADGDHEPFITLPEIHLGPFQGTQGQGSGM